ncbi:MAG TPA: hypothetical protein VHI78_13625 [Bacteroidales bacterium]|jgi:hypothetical protein|nr:hypothetical protein [Bacteroidales bacterium]
MKTIRLFFLLAMICMAGSMYAQDQPAVKEDKEESGMSESAGVSDFFVQIPHTKEQCVQTLQNMNDKGEQLLSDFEFGCSSGDHTAYGFVKAKSKEEVKQMLPVSEQASVKIVKVKKYTPAEIESMHKTM